MRRWRQMPTKRGFAEDLKAFRATIEKLSKDCASAPGNQVQRKSLLGRVESVAADWFDRFDPTLRWEFAIPEDVLDKYRKTFGSLLEASGGRPSKGVVGDLFQEVLTNFHVDLVVPVQAYRSYYRDFPIFEKLLSHSAEFEKEFLLEAIECARTDKRRAAIVLGWSAAVHRLHLYIEELGFDKFNQASQQMASITSGRYKRFNKRFSVHNLGDLQMSVFDRDLLWVLEFLGEIDGNEHERLEICLTMRNTSAHPGEAPFSKENLLSFFSDIDALVLDKFRLNS